MVLELLLLKKLILGLYLNWIIRLVSCGNSKTYENALTLTTTSAEKSLVILVQIEVLEHCKSKREEIHAVILSLSLGL